MGSLDVLQKIPKVLHREEAIDIDYKEFKNTIDSRRSVRVFTDKEIPQSVIDNAIEDALNAPNSSNLQTWKFLRVKTVEKKEKLIKYCMSQSAARTAKELIVCVVDLNQWRQVRKEMLDFFKKEEKETGQRVPQGAWTYYRKIVPLAYNQGFLGILGYIKKIIIFFRGLFEVIPREPTDRADMRVWSHKSCALACENLMLSLRAQGFDTCPMEGFDSKRVKKLLNLKSSEEVCMILACGQRAENGIYSKRIRMNKDNFYFEV